MPAAKEDIVRIAQLCDSAIEAQVQFLEKELQQQQKMVTAASGASGRVYEAELGVELAISANLSHFQEILRRRKKAKENFIKNNPPLHLPTFL